MSYRSLHRFGRIRDAAFYITALKYAQHLWRQGHSARSILALDRALFSHVDGSEEPVRAWPMPYGALRWILENHPGDTFLGNPRVSYQHIAGRVRGERRKQRSWRAWACWYIVRITLPDLPRDGRHDIEEPDREAIANGLQCFGIPGEAIVWASASEVDESPP